MPYSLNLQRPPEKVRAGWEGDDALDPGTPRRRFSLSTPEHFRTTMHRGASFSGDDTLRVLSQQAGGAAPSPGRGKDMNLTPSFSSSRVERLLRERQLRRSGSAFQLGDESVESDFGLTSRQGSFDGSVTSISEKQASPVLPAQRLMVVANRLPVSATRRPDGSWQLDLSAGGLVSALLGVKQNFETRWIGWPGLYVPDEAGRKSLQKALADKGCVPVFLDENTVDQYYNGYCNNVLWPLFHYIGLPTEDRLAATRSLQSQWAAYKRANEQFADTVLSQYQEGDVVWCHDYHLMLLPSYLKNHHTQMKVGWFLHTPFPSSEIYRTLPLRSEILRGVLAADLIGFHTYDYARHFVSACTRILGLEGTPDGVEDSGSVTRVAAFPIGIDPDRFTQALETDVVKTHIAELKARFAGRKVMLGVDRLDMIKGIPQKLLAFEKFLEENPDWINKVLLVQIAVPSRTDVPEYQKLTSLVHEIVGRINGRFGTLTTVPIHHLDRSLAFHELCALYAITDVALVTSLRDGMNLVSYEYVACQNERKGVLILSEFAGAAQSLGAGAILVNPWNVSDVAASIEDALTMSEAERAERHKHNFQHVTVHTAQAWADTFVSELNDTLVEAELRTLKIPPLLSPMRATEAFRASQNRLIVLGWTSTLTASTEAPRRRHPDQIKEMKVRLHPTARECLRVLCADPRTTLVVLSGSDRQALDEAFGDELDIWLAAENGMFLRHSSTKRDWINVMPEHMNMDWMESVQMVFDYFCERTPRSYVETRETSLVWNYKFADVEFGRVQARDMLQHLWTGPISNAAVDVVQGSKSVEVRPVGVSKGAAIERIVTEIANKKPLPTPVDFVLCIGHFLSKDEEIYTFFEPDEPEPAPGPPPEASTSNAAHADPSFHAPPASAAMPITEHPPPAHGPPYSHHLQHKSRRKTSGEKSRRGDKGKGHPGSALTRFPSSPDRTNGDGGAVGSPGQAAAVRRRWSWDGELDHALLDLKDDHYFSCAVGRKRSVARYSLPNSDEVAALLRALVETLDPGHHFEVYEELRRVESMERIMSSDQLSRMDNLHIREPIPEVAQA